MAYQFEDETSELVRQIFLLELLTSDGKGGAATLEGLQIALRVIRGSFDERGNKVRQGSEISSWMSVRNLGQERG